MHRKPVAQRCMAELEAAGVQRHLCNTSVHRWLQAQKDIAWALYMSPPERTSQCEAMWGKHTLANITVTGLVPSLNEGTGSKRGHHQDSSCCHCCRLMRRKQQPGDLLCLWFVDSGLSGKQALTESKTASAASHAPYSPCKLHWPAF